MLTTCSPLYPPPPFSHPGVHQACSCRNTPSSTAPSQLFFLTVASPSSPRCVVIAACPVHGHRLYPLWPGYPRCNRPPPPQCYRASLHPPGRSPCASALHHYHVCTHNVAPLALLVWTAAEALIFSFGPAVSIAGATRRTDTVQAAHLHPRLYAAAGSICDGGPYPCFRGNWLAFSPAPQGVWCCSTRSCPLAASCATDNSRAPAFSHACTPSTSSSMAFLCHHHAHMHLSTLSKNHGSPRRHPPVPRSHTTPFAPRTVWRD